MVHERFCVSRNTKVRINKKREKRRAERRARKERERNSYSKENMKTRSRGNVLIELQFTY